jgi:tetratricopeptide (TPR) repeat protein
MTIRLAIALGLLTAALPGWGQAQSTPAPYTPGTTYQTANPAYHTRNPFYFEGRVDWDLLKITTPSNAWEFAQRGIHEQDDLEDIPGAIADYQRSLSLNSLDSGSCQLITSAAQASQGANLNPPPCMFTVRLRLGNLLRESDSQTALRLFNEVLLIDPLRLGVNALIAETYRAIANVAGSSSAANAALNSAIGAYKAELALSPVTPLMTQLTGDLANNAHVHWELAEVYETLGRDADAVSELKLYLQATQWHSDVYPWRIVLAQKKIQQLSGDSSAN